jgi:hypothetical protein
MLRENIGETSGKITSQRVLRNLGGRESKNGDVILSERIDSGNGRKGDGHLLHRGAAGRYTLRRRARSNGDQGWRNGHLDSQRRRHDEQRWNSEV